MTTRTDSTTNMVQQLMRLVADLTVKVKAQDDLLGAQQETIEELARSVMRLQGSNWQALQMKSMRDFPRG